MHDKRRAARWSLRDRSGGYAAQRNGSQCSAALCRPKDSTSAPDSQPPFAYRVRKPGRGDGWPIVAKLTFFVGDHQPILAVAWKSQRGTAKAVSLPRCVLLDARQRGAVDFFLRNDLTRQMWRLPIAEFLKGRLRPDGEHYVPLAWLEPVPWRPWRFAETVICLGDGGVADSEPAQLTLNLGVNRG